MPKAPERLVDDPYRKAQERSAVDQRGNRIALPKGGHRHEPDHPGHIAQIEQHGGDHPQRLDQQMPDVTFENRPDDESQTDQVKDKQD